jgi:hypothetical protein
VIYTIHFTRESPLSKTLGAALTPGGTLNWAEEQDSEDEDVLSGEMW